MAMMSGIKFIHDQLDLEMLCHAILLLKYTVLVAAQLLEIGKITELLYF